jgi:hypothetical protein
MRQYRAAIVAAVFGVTVFVAGGIAGYGAFGGGDPEPDRVKLPSACDNFLAASEIFAESGPSAGIASTGDPLSLDAETRAYETLRGLLDSCGQELAARPE